MRSLFNIIHRGLKLLLLGLIIPKVFCLDIVHRSLERLGFVVGFHLLVMFGYST